MVKWSHCEVQEDHIWIYGRRHNTAGHLCSWHLRFVVCSSHPCRRSGHSSAYYSLSWALLQERITKTPYQSHPSIPLASNPPSEYFRFSIVLNTVQSFFASLVGALYLHFSNSRKNISASGALPSPAIFLPLVLISITSSLASPFGYASLAHVDYLTFVLAKSCKLLPVMFLHITLFQKKYPMYKYLVVFAVTGGVALFTISHPVSSSKSAKGAQQSSLYGLALLGINLLFDGLTNTVQDHIFTSPERYGKFTGPQMMVAQNIISTWMTISYLLLTPQIPSSMLPEMARDSTNELVSALNFLHRHPRILYDVLGFAACGAIGQVFIFATLERFSSLLLVTVTVTRKMLTMLLSVLWFGKRLTAGQWAGVGLVFAGVGWEGVMERRKKKLDVEDRKKKKT
jgi:solute carrier family 35 (UDP-galactose transporter), member B1